MEEKKVRSRTTSNQTGARQVRSRSLQPEKSNQRTSERRSAEGRNTQSRQTANRNVGQRTGTKRPVRRSQSKRRRKRNLMIKTMLLILLVMIAAVGAFLWIRYSPSDEKADLNEYYGIEKEEQVAVTIDNEVLEPAARIFDGSAYVQYEIVRDYINGRFYWDPNENVLLYTLPKGMVSVDVGSKNYTIAKTGESEEYVILKTEVRTAFIALDFIKKYTDMATIKVPKVMIRKSFTVFLDGIGTPPK